MQSSGSTEKDRQNRSSKVFRGRKTLSVKSGKQHLMNALESVFGSIQLVHQVEGTALGHGLGKTLYNKIIYTHQVQMYSIHSSWCGMMECWRMSKGREQPCLCTLGWCGDTVSHGTLVWTVSDTPKERMQVFIKFSTSKASTVSLL